MAYIRQFDRFRPFFVPMLLASAFISPAFAQFSFEPEGAHTDLYFPHLADGGPQSAKWQTAITLLNPNRLAAANVTLTLYADNGSPLTLDFGSGPASSFTLQIPALGVVTLRSTARSLTTLSGWAMAFADYPLQATVQFRSIINGVPQQEVSALSTLPATSYVSPATAITGVALANVYVSTPLTLNVTVLDNTGAGLGSSSVTVPPLGHTSFNLNQLFPALPASFAGSIKVTSANAAATPYLVGWTLSIDAISNVISSYPPGNQAWPINHVDRIRDVYFKDLNAAQYVSSNLGLGVQFIPQSVPLNILSDQILNAFASRVDDSVNIELALSELISDSPSELAFAVAHEMGHIIQYKTGQFAFSTNPELDADEWGMLISLVAGYDPYAAGGALSKLAMATNDASLISQQFDNISGDLHGSFDNRVALVYGELQAVCAYAGSFCSDYKLTFHPHFPANTPLLRTPGGGQSLVDKIKGK